MDKAATGLWLLKVSAAYYGLVTMYRLYTGSELYWSTLALPAIVLLALWRLQNASWYFFLSATFFVHFMYFPFLIIMRLLVMQFPIEPVWSLIEPVSPMHRIEAAICLLLALMIVRWNNPALLNPQNTRPLSMAKKMALTILAVLLLFSSRVEPVLWRTFDPRVLDNERMVSGLYFSPDGKKLGVTNADLLSSAHVWDIETRKFISLEAPPGVEKKPIGFSPDGKYVLLSYVRPLDLPPKATGVRDCYAVWELSSGKRLELMQPVSSALVTESAIKGKLMVNFSPDSKYLARSVVREKGIIEIWDISNESLVKTFVTDRSEFGSPAFAYSPNGRYIATQHGFTSLVIWDIETDATDFSFTKGNEGSISNIAYAPDGKFLAIAIDKRPPEGYYGETKCIDVWDMEARKIISVLQTGSITRMSYKPDGKHIAVISRPADQVEIWDVAKGRQIDADAGPVLNRPVSSMAYSPDGKYLAVANDRYIKLYNLQK